VNEAPARRWRCPADVGWSFALAVCIVAAISATFVFGALGLFVGVTIGWWALVPGVLCAAAATWAAWTRLESITTAVPAAVAITLAAVVLLTVVAGVIESRVSDTSTDGRHYHAEAVEALAHGWNPVRERPPATVDAAGYGRVESFPKATWFVEAAVRDTGVSLATSKLITPLLALAALLFAYVMLRALRLHAAWCVLGALILALNPVTSAEMFTLMVDSAVSSLLLIAIAGIVLYVAGAPRVLCAAMVAASSAMVVNLKFTGVMYAVIIITGTCVLALLLRKWSWAAAIRLVAANAVVVIVAMVVLGFGTFVVNQIRFANPFHPVLGKHALDITREYRSGNLANKHALELLAMSVASKSATNDHPTYKLPFVASSSEFSAFRSSTVTVGGFGPFFSGALLLAAVVALGLVWRRRSLDRAAPAMVLFGAAMCCAVSVILMPESWLARFAPQFWFVPALILLGALALDVARWTRVVAIVGVVLLGLNAIGIAGAAALWDVRDSRRESKALTELRNGSRNTPYLAEFGNFASIEAERLREHGVRFEIVPRVSCKKAKLFTAQGALQVVDARHAHRPAPGVFLCPKPRG
jgi:hypothetical protein